LIQFLKSTPLTEKQNEELLKIIYSMMEFSAAEIQELASARMVLKGGKSQKGNSNGNSRSNTSNNVTDEDGTKKKSGLFGILSKYKKD
jgi:hypothetical protein